jgi:hypothetical protein
MDRRACYVVEVNGRQYFRTHDQFSEWCGRKDEPTERARIAVYKILGTNGYHEWPTPKPKTVN